MSWGARGPPIASPRRCPRLWERPSRPDCRAPLPTTQAVHTRHPGPRPIPAFLVLLLRPESWRPRARGAQPGVAPTRLQKQGSPLAAAAWPIGSTPTRPRARACAGDSEAGGWAPAAPPLLLPAAALPSQARASNPETTEARLKHRSSPRGLPAAFLVRADKKVAKPTPTRTKHVFLLTSTRPGV